MLVHRTKKKAAVPVVDGTRWYAIAAAAEYMAVHIWFVRELIRKGKLPHQICGRGFVLDRLDMDQFLENNKAA
jgi:excisionase family DNA binding protein